MLSPTGRGNDPVPGLLLVQLSDAGHYRRLEFGVLRSTPSGQHSNVAQRSHRYTGKGRMSWLALATMTADFSSRRTKLVMMTSLESDDGDMAGALGQAALQ